MRSTRRVLQLFMIAALVVASAIPVFAQSAEQDRSATRPGGPLSALLGAIDRTVQDPQRAERVKAVVRELADELRVAQRELRARYRTLREMAFSYDTGRESLNRAIDELDRLLSASARRLIELRMQLKDLLTPEEWRSLGERIRAVGIRQP